MYCRGKTENMSPFEIKCANCGSYDVTVNGNGRYMIKIHCNDCDSELQCEQYNASTYNENGQNKGCCLFAVVTMLIAFVSFAMIFSGG